MNMNMKRGSSSRRKTISRSDLESFLCDMEDEPVADATLPLTNDENIVNIGSNDNDIDIGIAKDGQKSLLPVCDNTAVVVNDIVYEEDNLDIAHAVRQFCRVRSASYNHIFSYLS